MLKRCVLRCCLKVETVIKMVLATTVQALDILWRHFSLRVLVHRANWNWGLWRLCTIQIYVFLLTYIDFFEIFFLTSQSIIRQLSGKSLFLILKITHVCVIIIHWFTHVVCLVSSTWCHGWLLLCARCSSSAGLWSIKGVLCSSSGRRSGTECRRRLHIASWCHGRLSGCKVPTDLRHGAEDILPHGSSCSVGCRYNDVYCYASGTHLPNT